MKLLLTGDIHIGRRPGGLPAEVDGRLYSAGALWAAVVDKAIDEDVSAVLLSGDVVDRDNRMCEAFGPLERGLRKLGDVGIRTIAVSGNHDFDVLPALTRALPDDWFHLLGQKGKWERIAVEKNGRPVLYVDGWSYPVGQVRTSPLVNYDLPAADDAPVVGLLHTDVNTVGHPYAPVSRDELRAKPPRFWLLGHNHGPELEQHSVSPILYPGTPQAVNRKDVGPHGVWIAEVSAGGVTAEFHPIARVQYAALDVDLAGARSHDDVRVTTMESVRVAVAEAAKQNAHLRHLLFRVALTGRCRILNELAASVRELKDDVRISAGEAVGSIEKISIAVQPDRDLTELARETEASAVGALAELLLAVALGSRSGKCADLVAAAKVQMAAVGGSAAYAGLPAGDRPVEDYIRREGLRLLETLIAQREGGAS